MADSMRRSTATAIGSDLRLSGFRGGAASFEPKGTSGQAEVTISGAAYTLADKGRRRARARILAKSEALRTPWGPRRSVRGSTSRGKNITGRAAPKAMEAGKRAIVDAIRSGH
jgi:hypothetical protein